MLPLYDANGDDKGTIRANPLLFSVDINNDLIHQSIVMRLSNRRQSIAHTKTRAEVNVSKRKIFRQKGTGNARRGAKSTNLLRGGGVTHGPRNDSNFIKDMPKKQRRLALFSSLSLQHKELNVCVLEGYNSDGPKTRNFVKLLQKLPIGKKYLFVLNEKNEVFEKSARNIAGVQTILVNYLNPYDVLHANKVCFLMDSLDGLDRVFLSKKKELSVSVA